MLEKGRVCGPVQGESRNEVRSPLDKVGLAQGVRTHKELVWHLHEDGLAQCWSLQCEKVSKTSVQKGSQCS